MEGADPIQQPIVDSILVSPDCAEPSIPPQPCAEPSSSPHALEAIDTVEADGSLDPSTSAPADANGTTEADEPVALPPPPAKRHRWGPPKNEPGAGGDGAAADGAEKKRKRKSRWETDETAMAIVPAGNGSRAMVAVFPKEVQLSNGLKVSGRCMLCWWMS